jgi:DNA polymerase IV
VHVDFTEGVHTPAEQQTGKVLPTPPSTPHPSHIIDLTTPPATPLPPLLRPGKTPAVFTPPSSTHATPSKPQAKRPPRHLLPPDPPLTTNLEALSPGAPYVVQRASPLVCANQALAEELNVLRRLRALEGEARSELSYMRAIGTIKGMPFCAGSRESVTHLQCRQLSRTR